MEMNSMRTSSNDQIMQQQPMGGDLSISGRPPDLNNNNSSPQMLQPPPNTTLSMAPFPGLGDQHMGSGPGGGGSGGPPLPPPRCQISNPFLGTPPLVPHLERLQQQQQGTGGAPGGSNLNQMENAFNQDMRHRGYPGIINLPPPFQVNHDAVMRTLGLGVHPNLQSQIQAFQHDIGQHGGHMTQPPGFLQGFIPTEIVSTMPDSRSSHLLQPHVRQRARRRSRANRSSSIQLGDTGVEAPPTLSVGASEGAGDGASAVALNRSREMPPTAQITVDSAFGDSTGAAAAAVVAAAAGAAAGLEDAKLKGLEENYSSIGENFECNICFQKANEAVVTCCGHLFCWPCLYRWLHIHSYHKECPVCKGAIDESTITPIYGRECSAALLSARGLPGGSATERIPPRPPARRVESARQMREREDRGREREREREQREREQRERAERERSDREREQQQSESRGLAEVIVGQPPGVMTGSGAAFAAVTATSLEEGGGMMRDSTSSAIQSMQGSVGGGAGGGGGGEITITSTGGDRQLEEIDSRASAGFEDTSSSGAESMSHTTGPPGVNVAALSFQDPSTGRGLGGGDRSLLTVQLPGGGNNGPLSSTATNITNTSAGGTPAFLQRRVSDRREQLRAALAASARSSSVNSINSPTLGERVDDRRQMITAAALLSQEWEDIMSISRLVGPVNPVHAAAWMAAVQGGRFGSTTTEGTSLESLSDFPSHPCHQQQQHGSGGGGGGVMLSHSQPVHRPNASSRDMIASPAMISQDGGSGGEDSTSLSRLVSVNPLQAGDWLAAMRTRLTSMEKIVENLDSPLRVLQQPASLQLSFLPAQSSVSQGGHLVQTRSDIPAPGLEELSLLDTVQQSSSVSNSNTSMDGPSTRAVEERAAAAAASEAPPSSVPLASSSSTSTSTPVQNNARTQSEPRLHYREAPVPKPPTSRRRTSRPGEEGISLSSTSNNTTNNNRNQGQGVGAGGQTDTTTEGSGRRGPSEPSSSSSRTKRRRLVD